MLDETDRMRIWRGLMRWYSNLREEIDLSKDELRAAVDATDAWIDSNQANYNQALPTAVRDNLTLEQKTFLFCAVALARVGIGILRQVFGEVN